MVSEETEAMTPGPPWPTGPNPADDGYQHAAWVGSDWQVLPYPERTADDPTRRYWVNGVDSQPWFEPDPNPMPRLRLWP